MNKKIILLFSLFLPLSVAAEPVSNEADLDQLLELDLYKLMNVKISLASRTRESQFGAAAAVYVITSEDIARSGHRRLSEILRLVPGLHVGKLDANKWAVTSRNSLSRYTSTMLVMIDGRHIYTPLYGGVYWEIQDTFLEDIERIEVVRGPGAALWGANAVDGIINIITKSSSKTQGSKSYLAAGVGEMHAEAGTRYGGKLGNGGNYRVYAKGYKLDSGEYLGPTESTNNGLAQVGADANDDGWSGQIGYRADWASGIDQYTIQGDIFNSRFNEDRIVGGSRVPNQTKWSGQNILFHWQRDHGNAGLSQFKAFYNVIHRDDDILKGDEANWEFDYQHTMTRGRHGLAYGVGYRNFSDTSDIPDPMLCTAGSPCFGLDPASKTVATVSAFVQDRYRMSDTVTLIFGSKFEHNGYFGFEYEPTVRLSWTPNDSQTLWGAITRSALTPTRVSRDGILDFGAITVPIGNKDAESSIIYTYETGYRHRFARDLIVDGTVFLSDYRNTLQAGDTRGRDEIHGFEGYLKQQVNAHWGWEAGYTYHSGDYVLATGGTVAIGTLPTNSLNLRLKWDVDTKTKVDAFLYYTDEHGESLIVPGYTRVDLRWSRRVRKDIETSIRVTNVLDDVHAEATDSTKINTGIKRGIEFRIEFDY